MKHSHWRNRLYAYWDGGSGWFSTLIIGIVVGLFAAFIDIGSKWLTDLKLGICADGFWLNKEQCCWLTNETDCSEWYAWSKLFTDKDFIDNHGNIDAFSYALSYFFYILWGLLLALLTVLFVRTFAPYACGSGIPEIKTILSGFVIKGYLGKWTLIIKSVGMMLAVSTGLSLGKEGPMVHMASCVGNIVSYLFPKYGKNEAKRREILSASAAAGVAVAFGAPIGGVLFSLEEVSFYFPLKTMFRSFFCALCAAQTLRLINPFGEENLILFKVDTTDMNWVFFELIPFAFLGALGGIFGAIFIRANIYVCQKRKTTRLGNWPVHEVAMITFITLILAFPCEYLRMDSGALIKKLFNACIEGDESDLCKYKRNVSDPKLVKLGSYPADNDMFRAMGWLSYALIVKVVITVFTFGLKIPSGLFIPSMAVGAIMGRMVGVATEQFAVYNRGWWLVEQYCKSNKPCVNPGVYGIIGAASALSGVTRTQISLVVIVLELTGGLRFILPLMVAALVSKWVGDRLTHGGMYDQHIKLNGYPFLSGQETLQVTSFAADCMQPRTGGRLQVIVQDNMTLHELETILLETTYKGFPVVVSHDSHYIVGFVTRRDLCWTLDQIDTNSGVTGSSVIYFTEQLPADVYGPTPLHLRHIVDLCPVTVTDQTPIDTVMDLFCKLGLRQVLVSQNGRLHGIITKKDVLRHVEKLESFSSSIQQP